jgi:hypothetical protein
MQRALVAVVAQITTLGSLVALVMAVLASSFLRKRVPET